MAVNLRPRSVAFPGYKTKWGVEENYFAAQGTDLDHSMDSDKADGSGFGTAFKNDLPTIADGTIKISGLASMGQGQVSDVLDDYRGRTKELNLWYATQGLAFGSPIRFQPSRLIKHSIKAKMKDSVQFDSEWAAAGASDKGFILVSPNSLITGTTFTSSILINKTATGLATNFGGVLVVHMLTLAGGTSPTVTVKIQHSDDGEDFTDLAGATTAALTPAATSARIEIPSTTVVNGQLQALVTVAGTPTEVQMLAGIARGKDPDA